MALLRQASSWQVWYQAPLSGYDTQTGDNYLDQKTTRAPETLTPQISQTPTRVGQESLDGEGVPIVKAMGHPMSGDKTKPLAPKEDTYTTIEEISN
jgi:hypothetical protein